MGQHTSPATAPEWLVGGGELGDRIRARDWASTPLGPRSDWPESLRSVVNVIVASRIPMALLWGAELVLLYNDDYGKIAGARHPAALGRPTREVWPEVWHLNEPIFGAVLQRGETIYLENEPFPIERGGAVEDAWFTLCYSPVRVEDRSVGGALVTLYETTARRDESRRLRAERQRALDTFEHGDACVVLDPEYRILLVNAEQERLSGTTRKATIGRHLWEVWPDTGNPEHRFRRHYDRAMRDRAFVTFEDYYEPLSRWLDVRVYPTTEGGIAVFFHDVTERRAAESELRRNDERLRLALRVSRSGTFDWDAKTNANSWSDELLALYGIPRSEFGGRSEDWIESLVPEDRSAGIAAFEAAQRTGEFALEFRIRRRDDGEIRWMDGRGQVFFDAEGRPERMVGLNVDITERKRAEEALRVALAAAEERGALLAAMMEHIPMGITIAEAPDVNIREVSRYGRELLEKTSEELTGIPAEQHPDAWAVFHADGVTRATADELPLTRATVAGEKVAGEEWVVTRKDGFKIPILCTAAPILDREGRIQGGVIGWQDLTDRKRSEEALREANERLREADRRKDEFIGVLSHELRNPLAPIRNSIFALERGDRASSQAEKAVSVIRRQTEHLSRLVDDLLDVTRIVRGKIQIRRERVDVAEVVRRAAEDLRPVLAGRNLVLSVDVAEGKLWARADEARVAQVVGNLLHNARKFTPEGGQIWLTLRRKGPVAEVVVRDDGVGIDPDLLPRVFEPFVQAKQTLARSGGGLGLGLALVKGIVELHGGTVRAESAGLGHGATFAVTFPLTLALAEPAPTQQASGEPPARRRVLVVDDNVDAAESLAQLVEILGFTADVVYDGSSALKMAETKAYDVILCDIGMPGLSGYEVAKELRLRLASPAQLIAVTGYAQPEDVARAREAGFDAHVAKPPDPNHLLRLLA